MSEMKRSFLIAACFALAGCASAYNLSALRSLDVPGATLTDRAQCEGPAIDAGRMAIPDDSIRFLADLALWPVPELMIMSQRDEAALSAYQHCLDAKGSSITR